MIDTSLLNIIPDHAKLIVGVSGGADSVALLHLLVEGGMNCIVAHCNFHLRGSESDRDASFVKNLAREYDLPYYQVDFKTEEYAKSRHLSIEMAARELRYDWFKELIVREKADYVAVAHHADDLVETFLINLSRGTGLHGLTGMKEINGKVVRPLLSVWREEIKSYVRKNRLSYVEDSSNAIPFCARNKFRNDIIPGIEETFPYFKKSLFSTIHNLRDAELFMESQIQSLALLEQKDGDSFKISKEKVKSLYSPIFALYESLSSYGFSYGVVADAVAGVDKPSGKAFLSRDGRFILRSERGYWVLTRNLGDSVAVYSINKKSDWDKIPISLSVREYGIDEFHLIKDKNICYLDAEKVSYPFVIRHWLVGDYFVPFGMKGKKKLSDYFIDNSFSEEQKKSTLILVNDEDIVWILGERADDRFKIDEKTKRVLELKYMK
jgi:tRNA(Ile)-lysidine synthase